MAPSSHHPVRRGWRENALLITKRRYRPPITITVEKASALTFWRLFRTYMAYSRVNQESSYAKEVISCSRFVFLENDSRHTDLQRGFLSPKFLGNCLRKTNMESRRTQINILIGVSYQVQDFIDDACFGWSKMAAAKFKICEGCSDELGSQHIWLGGAKPDRGRSRATGTIDQPMGSWKPPLARILINSKLKDLQSYNNVCNQPTYHKLKFALPSTETAPAIFLPSPHMCVGPDMALVAH
ncbi:hypothetical protein NC653_025721 [Populus alba x Populus x berolinensis]|uniref:Uncharacterized protein n=1 Tax=Populus alba x Populus x berolinensis TaxID=444605 RepID=A0AAD6MD09_9ROSI|nr:hypothetical protein NC653_025721 [Populus alba x Populus x berolinensis]